MELQNTNLFIGKESTKLNQLLKQYNQLKEQISDLETTKKAVTKEILDMCNNTKGKYQTSTTVFTISYTEGRVNINAKTVQEKYPNVYEELATKGEGYFQIRNITPIGTSK